MNLKSVIAATALLASIAIPQQLLALKATGEGSVAITSSDPQTVKSTAEKKAMADAIVSAIKKLQGSVNVPPEDPRILQLIKQRDSFLKSEPKIERDKSDSAVYAVKVTLEIDDAAFVDELGNVRLGALNTKTENLGSIVVFIDEAIKRDMPNASEVPLEERIDYKRDNSKSYKENSSKSSASASASSMSIKDKSSASYSEKNSASGKASAEASYDDKYAARASSQAAVSGNGMGAYGRDDAAVAASSKGSAKQSASYAASSESKGAYSKDFQASASSSASKSSSSSRNVNSQVNDKEEYHYAKTINTEVLKPQSSLNDAMKNELEATLGRFGVKLEDGTGLLADFNKGSKKKYGSYNEAMKNDGDGFKNFIRKKRPEASYIGIGTLEIGYNPAKDSTGDYRCGLNAGTISIVPLKTNAKLPGGSLKTMKSSNSSSEGCMNNIRVESATELGGKIGALVQKNARDKDLKAKQEMFD